MLFLVSTFGEGFEEYNYLQFCVDPGVNNLDLSFTNGL